MFVLDVLFYAFIKEKETDETGNATVFITQSPPWTVGDHVIAFVYLCVYLYFCHGSKISQNQGMDFQTSIDF